MIKLTCAIFTIFLAVQISLGQCPEYDIKLPRLEGVVLKALVTKETNQPIFTYRYTLSNGVASTGCMERFELDLSYPDNSMELPTAGLVDYPRYIDRSAFKFDQTLRMIPVGIPKLPSYKTFRSAWFAGFGLNKRIDWGSAVDKFKLEPGSQLDSIIMTSYGLPTLRSFIISPSYNPRPAVIITPANEDSVRRYVPEPTPEEEEAFQRLIDSIKVRGITIGPTSPPAYFVAVAFLDTLISYKHQAAALGWLKDKREDKKDENDEDEDDTIVKKLDKRLEKVRKELVKGDSAKAREELQKFVKKIEKLLKESAEAVKEKKEEKVIITSEAYALLKYNAEYLIDRLPKKKKDDDD